uniref:Non-structural polyprotein n=1 Tax=Fuchs virus TaxID=2707220 RepID=A0A6H0DGY0_9VIRU|nr:MAG: non-structural polyprotein [Fuchs virus]
MVGGNPFSSNNTRAARAVQMELAKVVSSNGQNDALARAKDKAQANPLWLKFNSLTVAMVCRDIDHWVGLTRTCTWLRYERGNITNLDTVEDPKLTTVEEALCMEKYYDSVSKKNMTTLIENQTRKLKDLTETVKDVSDVVSRLRAEKVKLKDDLSEAKMEIARLKRCLREEKAKQEVPKSSPVGLNFLVGFLGFLLFCWLIPATSAEALGCTVIEANVPFRKLSYKEAVAACWETQSVVFAPQLDEGYLYETCMIARKDIGYCQEMARGLVARRIQLLDGLMKLLEPARKVVEVCVSVFEVIDKANLSSLIVACVSLVYVQSKHRAIMAALCHLVGWLTGSGPLPLVVVLNYLPVLCMPFLLALLIAPPEYVILIWLLAFVTLQFEALLGKEGVWFQRVAGATTSTLVLIGWNIVTYCLRQMELNIVTQVLLGTGGAALYAGINAAAATVTVANPDGTVEKHKRYGQWKDSIATKLATIWQKAKAVRGIIPSFPVKEESIFQVEVTTKDGVFHGTGFRLGNYVYTAGHVTAGAEKVVLKWKDLKVQTKVLGKIELNLYTDTLVRLQLPAAFSTVPSLRVAKEANNDYYQMITFGNNSSQVVTFTGWGSIDDEYFSAPFETYPGTSGSPIIDRTGKIVAVHFGTNMACSSGYVITTLFRVEPPVKTECSSDPDAFLQKVTDGVRQSHADMMAKIEELLERVKTLESKHEQLAKVHNENVDKRNSWGSKLEARIKKLEEQEMPELEPKQTLVEEAKGKSKKTVRGAKHRYRAVANMVKRRLRTANMLTEEEYKRLEEEGFSKEEIRDIVENLREQAFLQWQLDNEDDWEDSDIEDWEREMMEDDEAREEQDRAYSEFEDAAFGGRTAHMEKARLKVLKATDTKSKSLDIKFPDGKEKEARELVDKIVTDEPVPEGASHVVIYYDDEGAMYVDDKRVTLKRVRLEGHTRVVKNKETVIDGPPQAQVVQKISTTTELPPAEPSTAEGKDAQPTIEEKKKKQGKLFICQNCNEPLTSYNVRHHRCGDQGEGSGKRPKNGRRAPRGAQ